MWASAPTTVLLVVSTHTDGDAEIAATEDWHLPLARCVRVRLRFPLTPRVETYWASPSLLLLSVNSKLLISIRGTFIVVR